MLKNKEAIPKPWYYLQSHLETYLLQTVILKREYILNKQLKQMLFGFNTNATNIIKQSRCHWLDCTDRWG
jgi:hypothetical protein